MLIGVISDTHDDIRKADEGARALRAGGAQLVVHLGDWCSPFTVLRFRGLPLRSVLGNNDGDLPRLARAHADIGAQLVGRVLTLDAGLSLCALHGEDPPVVDAIARSGLYDVVLRGHTHQMEETVVEARDAEGTPKRVRILNPGWSHVLLLDTATGEARFVRIQPEERDWPGVLGGGTG